MRSIGTKIVVLLLGQLLCTDVACSLPEKQPSVVYHLEGDSILLKCPVGNNSYPPIWWKNKEHIVLGKTTIVNKSDDLYERIKVHGLQDKNQEYIIEIENLTKTDNAEFCCVTNNISKDVVRYCTDVVVIGEDDININVTNDGLLCTMKYTSDSFSYSWRHFSSSGYHLACDDVEGNSINFKRFSHYRSEGKYMCIIHDTNKSIEKENSIHKPIERKENGNLSCTGGANIDYFNKRKTIVISFLVENSHIMNNTWKQNAINLMSSKFIANVQIKNDEVKICDESVEVNSTIYRLEIRNVVATDFNHNYTLVVSGSNEDVSCSHFLTQNEIKEIGDKNTTTNVLSYYILACFCLAMIFAAAAFVISWRRKAKRRQSLT